MLRKILAVDEIALTATWFVVSGVFAVAFTVQERSRYGRMIAENSNSTVLPFICAGSAVMAAIALILMIRERRDRSKKRF
jgi:uncharacterized membrane protein HdeD (DUF308 family)